MRWGGAPGPGVNLASPPQLCGRECAVSRVSSETGGDRACLQERREEPRGERTPSCSGREASGLHWREFFAANFVSIPGQTEKEGSAHF